MDTRIDPRLKLHVERFIRERFPESILDGILIEEDFDADGDKIVKVVVLLKEKPEVSQVSGLTRQIWGALSRDNFGFPILSFRSVDENARLSAAA
ncbi:MAG: hypothetical protein C0515_06940 [Novosphingobium sp.]|nr:hypothetical protein [Novosphingobium sp.]